MKWRGGGTYRVGKIWVVIFRVGIPQGKFDGLEFSEWERSMRNFPRTLKHVGVLKNLIREIFLSLGTAVKIMLSVCIVLFMPFVFSLTSRKWSCWFLLSSAVFSRFVVKKPRTNHLVTFLYLFINSGTLLTFLHTNLIMLQISGFSLQYYTNRPCRIRLIW